MPWRVGSGFDAYTKTYRAPVGPGYCEVLKEPIRLFLVDAGHDQAILALPWLLQLSKDADEALTQK